MEDLNLEVLTIAALLMNGAIGPLLIMVHITIISLILVPVRPITLVQVDAIASAQCVLLSKLYIHV